MAKRSLAGHARDMSILDLAEARAALPKPERCRSIRLDAALSLLEVAAELGTNPITVSRWERGERHPSKRYVVAYARLLADLAAMTQPGGPQ